MTMTDFLLFFIVIQCDWYSSVFGLIMSVTRPFRWQVSFKDPYVHELGTITHGLVVEWFAPNSTVGVNVQNLLRPCPHHRLYPLKLQQLWDSSAYLVHKHLLQSLRSLRTLLLSLQRSHRNSWNPSPLRPSASTVMCEVTHWWFPAAARFLLLCFLDVVQSCKFLRPCELFK